jgi:hypothetical protein
MILISCLTGGFLKCKCNAFWSDFLRFFYLKHVKIWLHLLSGEFYKII